MKNREKRRLIILEDEPAHAEAIQRSLLAFEIECNIIVATSLAQFHQIISTVTPDLVIADINLPDGSAFSLLSGNIENQSWPMLIMTSFSDEELAVKAIKSGALDYIVKSPDAFKDIGQTVKRNLREWYIIQKSRENERKFRSLFETMTQGVIYQDAHGKITAANSAAEKILGITLEQMQSKNLSDLPCEIIREDGLTYAVENCLTDMVLQSGKPVKNAIVGIRSLQNGHFTWLLVNAIPQFRDNETKPYEVFTTFTDITEMKHAELELKKAKERAEESDRFKTAFMANISHEIRTPMSGILGFADLLKKPDLSSESQATYIEAIVASGKRMLGIINDLINISKIEAEQHAEMKTEVTDINKVLDELFIFFLPEANKKEIVLKINKELPRDKFSVETDKTKLSQIITNLIKNALKFTRSGFVEFGCKIENKSYLFFVKDTGTGIKKEFQEKIFERFFHKGDMSPSSMQEGVGIGLAISKAYVQLLGGTIWVESNPAEGSVFYFTIPLKEPVQTAPVTNKEPEKIQPVHNSDVLIAEDEELIYFYLNEALKLRNVNTAHARNGLEAVNAVKTNPDIKLVLMDIRMPEMNGLEATTEIKKIKPELPVIALSALVNDSDIQNALEAGCDDYLAKPIDMNALLDKISFYAKIPLQ